ncbi:MAG: hypothetical protein Q8L48_10705 [Archangium sp.]|nr:hypothetical protein [Archangium sp.]
MNRRAEGNPITQSSRDRRGSPKDLHDSMRRRLLGPLLLLAAALPGCGLADDSASATSSLALVNLPRPLAWETVANNATLIPGGGAKTFSSYNQPSVNGSGFVVFRARSTGSEGGGEGEALVTAASEPSGGGAPVRGIFTRDMFTRLSPGAITPLAANGCPAPAPNNLGAPFNEFPSIPRIDLTLRTIATRAQSQPVWEYSVGPDVTTRVGTSGVYANPGGVLQAGANLLGAVTDWTSGQLSFAEMQVPGTRAGTRFDQFPGAPGVAGSMIVFKGNWTDVTVPSLPAGRTGVYFRDLASPTNRIQRVADNVTSRIPGTTTLFGSTAPPSAAKGFMVFVGSDNEDNPTAGGVYRAPLRANPPLQVLARIGGPVPNARGQATSQRFTRFGEGLSYDGRYVAFWASWGTATRPLQLRCVSDGNKEVIAWCVAHSANLDGWYTMSVPANQGLFVHDTRRGKTWLVAQTGPTFRDFLFWNYSGRPPGTGGGDGEDSYEPPRWRTNAFAAVNGTHGSHFQLAFKAQHTDGSTGLYLIEEPEMHAGEFRVLVDTRTSAWDLDLGAPPADAAGNPLRVTSVGLERDAFRSDGDGHGDGHGHGHGGGWSYLVINSSMANADASVSWAGIYLARIRNPDGDDDRDDDRDDDGDDDRHGH